MTDLRPEHDDGARGYVLARNALDLDTFIEQARRRQPRPTTPLETPSPDRSFLEAAGDVASDVGRGAFEVPLQSLGGAIEGMREIGQAFQDWTAETFRGIDVPTRTTDMPDLDAILPNVPEARSTTGGVARGIAQFLVGRGVAGRVIGTASRAGTAGRLGNELARGAFSDAFAFDPDDPALANLVQDHPELQNPVTEFLATDPNDSEGENRLKRAVEGLGLGALTEGFLLALKGIRAARAGRGAAAEERQAAETLSATETAERASQALTESIGDTAAPLVKATPGGPVEINWSRIDAPQDVQNVIRKMKDAFAGEIDEARRGTRSHKATKLSAEQVDAWDVLQNRRQGAPLNAEESLAARQLWVTSAEKLQELARSAADTPSETNLFAFRRQLANHYAIQQEVIAARTETARALNAWAIPAGSSRLRMQQIEDMLDGTGGADLHRGLAQRIAAVPADKMAEQLDAVVRGTFWARTRDSMLEYWINGLLSGPKTHLVNMMSNTSVAALRMVERDVAARIGQAFGTEAGVAVGEASAQAFGVIQGLKDAFSISATNGRLQFDGGLWRALRTGQTGFGINKIETRQRAISSEAFGLARDTAVGRTVDVLGTLVGLPGRFLGAEDEVFKSIGYRMELSAQALRRARQEVDQGLLSPDDLKSRIADIIADPPDDIRLEAIDSAVYQTFTNKPPKLAMWLSKMAQDYPAARLLLPFVRTPANIFTFTMERTPIAPLMGQYREAIKAGGARADIARAQMAVGTSIMFLGIDLAQQGHITGRGPSDAGERDLFFREGRKPYAVKLGDRWFQFNRLDPVGMTLGIAADMSEIFTNADLTEESQREIGEVFTAALASVASNTMSKTYLSGISEFVGMLDKSQTSVKAAERWLGRTVGSFVPFSSAVGEVRRQVDPYMRASASMIDEVYNRLPGLSESLPKRRDLWGRPITYQSGLGRLYDIASPIYSSRENPEPIDQELRALSETTGYFPRMPQRRVVFDGIAFDTSNRADIYYRFVELAGNASKDPAFGLGTKDMLNAMVQGRLPGFSEAYAASSPEGKANLIRKVISDGRERAKSQVMDEFPEIGRFVAGRRR